MREKIIQFFLNRHLLANLIFISVFIGGVAAWNLIPKEEYPDITFDTVRISVHYPGASAEEVEYYVTRPIEEEIRGLDGIYRITSATGIGSSSVSVEIERNYEDKEEVISEIRNAVLDVDLPEDIIDDPNIRVFKTSRKAIMDVGLFLSGKRILDVESRDLLQTYVLALENKLLSLPEISSVSRKSYLKEEIQIKVDPQKLLEYQIPFNMIISEIQKNNVRQPAGSIENIREPKVTLDGELTTIEELDDLAIQGGFEGQVVRLKELATVVKGYEKTKEVLKINGHEGIFLNVIKSSQSGILDARDAVLRAAEQFKKNNINDSDIQVILLDDESVDLRNRLKLITTNGSIGFGLILISLFIFLNFRAAFWVALGIPFTFCLTLIAALLAGYTVNNITLAAIIIVMGMVVDDAIVVSENITRLKAGGMPIKEAAVKGTSFVFLPIIGSILTTCVAFIPLYFFTGRFGVMVKFIPLIVIFMLGGSLGEALFILPGHMTLGFNNSTQRTVQKRKNWFEYLESAYGFLIEKLLYAKWLVLIIFVGLLVFSAQLASSMKFVMFPDEETREIHLRGEAPPGTTRYETARLTQPIENILDTYKGKEVIGYRNEISKTRRGSAAQENKFRMRIEILPKEKRQKSADDLVNEWKEKLKDIPDITDITFSKTWHGQSGGSPIEILVKENNDAIRKTVADKLAQSMKEYPELINAEIERPILSPEYRIKLDRDKIRRLAISSSDVARTLRAALEGNILYDFMSDDEEVYVRLTTIEDAKNDIEEVLQIPVENEGKYLVPLKDIVFIEKVEKPDAIIREDLKRTTTIYADLAPGTKLTPLEIAEYFENNVFGKITAKYPSTILEFTGEVKDTRESQRDFNLAIILTIALIYLILVLLFNSLFKPLIIMLSIPFGVVGIIFTFSIHGITQYGFFAIIGALGLAGVVVNDAIIMLTKLDSEFDNSLGKKAVYKQVGAIAKTRLRAVILTTLTTVLGIFPTAYGWAGFDAMLSQMMLALSWGLVFGTLITLVLIPCVYAIIKKIQCRKIVTLN